MQPNQNFWKYREYFNGIQAPKIPYLAVSLRDFTFINVGNPTYTEEGAINVERLNMLYEQVKIIKRLQKRSMDYDFTNLATLKEESLINYIYNLPFIDNEEILHELSSRFLARANNPGESHSYSYLFQLNDSSDSSLSLSIKERGKCNFPFFLPLFTYNFPLS